MLNSLKEVTDLHVTPQRFFSATHEELKSGLTTDIYFINTKDVLRSVNMLDTQVTAEIFTRTTGMFAGLDEIRALFKDVPVSIEVLPEGEYFSPKEVVMRIRGPYGAFGIYETVLLGILSSSCAWATAARECVEAAEGKPVLVFGARHLHPAIAPVMEAVSVKFGGCTAASCVLGAKLCGREPSGTVPHAAILIMGDTVKLAEAYDSSLPPEIGRTFLVDTFHDECEEALRLARSMGRRLGAVRLDTPSERGGVTAELVKEMRYRLNHEGFDYVKIVVSGGLNPERIKTLSQAGADIFGVGSYIAHAVPMDMTMDLKEVGGKPVAKRGRLPGVLENKRLIAIK